MAPATLGSHFLSFTVKLSQKTLYLSQQEAHMLWTIAVILFVLWAVGLVSSYTMGGFIHVLLVLAVLMVLARVIQGRRVV